MACSLCLQRAMNLRWTARAIARLSPSGVLAMRAAEAQRLLETFGPDIECPGLRFFGGNGPKLAPEGRRPARVCAVCDHVFCPRVEPLPPPEGRRPAQVCAVCDHVFCPRVEPLPPPEAAPPKAQGDPRHLFGLLDVQDDDDPEGDG